MSSSNDHYLKKLEDLTQFLCETLPSEIANEVGTLLSAAYTAAHTEDRKISQNALDVTKNTFDKLFQQMEEIANGTYTPFEDPTLIWMEEHVNLVAPYRGKTVAIDFQENKIIASGDTFDDVWDQVETMDPAIQDRVSVDFVPDEIWS